MYGKNRVMKQLIISVTFFLLLSKGLTAQNTDIFPCFFCAVGKDEFDINTIELFKSYPNNADSMKYFQLKKPF